MVNSVSCIRNRRGCSRHLSGQSKESVEKFFGEKREHLRSDRCPLSRTAGKGITTAKMILAIFILIALFFAVYTMLPFWEQGFRRQKIDFAGAERESLLG